MKRKNEIESYIIIAIGSVVILFLLNTGFKASNISLDDFEYFKGYVADGDVKKVWLATDTTVDVHSFAQRDSILYFENSDSDVISKLKEVRYNPDHIVEVWYQNPIRDHSHSFPGSGVYSPLIRQIALDGEIILSFDKYVSWKISLFISIPILGIIIYLILGLVRNDNENDKQ